ncbi:hypothetical protein [Hymenobacter sp. BT730]|uniref:hypothetical protein n=1 Tax=Hymenobacter sp. BT730 TaxID=3063332 RepID=UPI0026E0518F|nr:hypothetical protein [Hymenobacter sp. BT730]
MSLPPSFSEDDAAWTALLRTLPSPSHAEPRPYFFTRLQARLDAQQPQPAALPTWLRRPVYALLLGALVLALNADTALHYVRQHRVTAPLAIDDYNSYAAAY